MSNIVNKTSIKDVSVKPDLGVWKFSNKEKSISELTHRETILCSLHCFKKMRYYGDQIHYYQYRINIAKSQKEEDKYHYHKTRCMNNVEIFNNLLNNINVRANQLGFMIPDNFEQTKELFDKVIPDERKITNMYHLSESIT